MGRVYEIALNFLEKENESERETYLRHLEQEGAKKLYYPLYHFYVFFSRDGLIIDHLSSWK